MKFKANIANASLSANEIKIAKTALYTYKFPVMSAVFTANGELLNSLNTNTLIAVSEIQSKPGNSVKDPMTLNYLRFLHEAIDKNQNMK